MPRIVISRLFNPFLNLAYESTLLKALDPTDHLLFLYINDPCVVIGRNQNPWKECNLLACRDLNIPVVRRRSGGGTVVHDRGNVNFCVQGPRTEFSRSKHIDLIVKELRERGAILDTNARNDIVNGAGQKVSGSSFKIERLKAYHHATMLLDTNLANLRLALHRPASLGTIQGLGTDSVRSPVANAGISQKLYIEAWVEAFKKEYGAVQPEYFEHKDVTRPVLADAQKLSSWEWVFGETPKFDHKIGHLNFHVERGIIENGPKELIGREYRCLGISSEVDVAIDPSPIEPALIEV